MPSFRIILVHMPLSTEIVSENELEPKVTTPKSKKKGEILFSIAILSFISICIF